MCPRSEHEKEMRLLEKQLLDPNVRRSTVRIDELLDDEFQEFGQSGSVFDKDAVLEALKNEPGFSGERSIVEFNARKLSSLVSLVTYRVPESKTLRSSIWRFDGTGWRMVFHQGTPSPKD